MSQPSLPVFLALDVSKNRVGYAVNKGALVFGRGSFDRTRLPRDLKAILHKQRQEAAAVLVLGLPLSIDGSASPTADRVRSFGRELQKVGAEVVYQDERFTTRRARELGATDLDEAAAVQILELYVQGRVARLQTQAE
ncbi:Holliday junction resolvase RuvX [Deinococcus psychrotolerans]|uniref:Putative pre-16S rRNA nuclease n=1 Tax=Deinococcus psychrotolerans TaxID=2489213 RepID=A0A3G8YC82_9DEIO|nr:RuvX/YqgF family protein [Deinococcus psychrotolerans]AZI42533.1 Holliday junction resolvase RuvX [Deinococcus psychrotolerans]